MIWRAFEPKVNDASYDKWEAENPMILSSNIPSNISKTQHVGQANYKTVKKDTKTQGENALYTLKVSPHFQFDLFNV